MKYVIAAVSLIFLALTVTAQETTGEAEGAQNEGGQGSSGPVPEQVFPAWVDFSSLVGVPIETSDGSMRGTVADAVVASGNTIPYLVASVNESPEDPETLYLVPTGVLKPGPGGASIVVDLPAEPSVNLPTLDENLIVQNMSDWDAGAREFWGADSAPAVSSTDPVRATRLLTYAVRSDGGTELGTVRDFGIDTASKSIAMYRLSLDSELGSGEVALPAVRIEREPGSRVLTIADEVFQAWTGLPVK